MSSAIAQLAFDYGDIPAAETKALERHAENVLKIQERQRKTTAENVLKLGEELKAAQERLSNHGNGTFGKWCVQRCGITSQTARRWIAVHELANGKDRNNLLQSFDVSALYLLSADTCPEEAIADALKLAKKGEIVTHKRAKELQARYTVGDRDESEEQMEDEEELASFIDLGGDRTKTFCALCDIRKQWPTESWQEFIAVLETVIEETRNAISD